MISLEINIIKKSYNIAKDRSHLPLKFAKTLRLYVTTLTTFKETAQI